MSEGVSQCEHSWPVELEYDVECENGCGLTYGEWSE